MKKFRKIMAVVAAMAMTVAMGFSSLAADGDVSLSVSNPVDGHTYKYFQLFTGDLSNTTLSNVKWGADAAKSVSYKTKDADGNFSVDTTATPENGKDVPAEVLEYLGSLSSKTNTDVAQETANIVSSWVTGDGHEIKADTKVAKGYYVIRDSYTDPTDKQTTTLSTNIVAIVDSTAIEPKAGTTSHKKEVLDVNDTDEAAIDLTNLKDVDADKWSKSADHDFGDHVPFKLTTTIGSDIAKYENYYLAVSDTMDNGLKLDQDSIEVYVDGKKAEVGNAGGQYTVSKDDHNFKVEFTKLNGNANAAAGKDVVIYYTAELTDKAVIGNPGNKNESYAEFSNNPNGNQNGHGTTPHDTVVVFTYKTDVDKIKPDGEALEGAGFTLYKKYYAEVTGKTNAAADLNKNGEFWYAVGTEQYVETGKTNFMFKGIDDGTYMLVETHTPAGYNTIEPITLVVTATHDADEKSSTGYSITSLTTDNASFKAAANGGEIKFTKVDKTEKTLESGEIYSEIVNKQGSQLPTTGGMGTTILYVAGAILVIAGAAVLVIKKRHEA